MPKITNIHTGLDAPWRKAVALHVRELVENDPGGKKAFVEKTGMCLPTVEKIMKQVTAPPARLIVVLSQEYHVSADWLLGLNDEEPLMGKYAELLDSYKGYLMALQRKAQRKEAVKNGHGD